MAKLNWQKLDSDRGAIYRAKVPGGWLVLVETLRGRGITFYPDPNHIWDGSSMP